MDDTPDMTVLERAFDDAAQLAVEGAHHVRRFGHREFEAWEQTNPAGMRAMRIHIACAIRHFQAVNEGRLPDRIDDALEALYVDEPATSQRLWHFVLVAAAASALRSRLESHGQPVAAEDREHNQPQQHAEASEGETS